MNINYTGKWRSVSFALEHVVASPVFREGIHLSTSFSTVSECDLSFPSSSSNRVMVILQPQMRVRRVRVIQRAGFVTSLPVQDKRIPRSDVTFTYRSVVEGSSAHRLRTVLGAEKAQ